MTEQLQLTSTFSPERFLRDYWQKKPLLIRGAFDGFKNPLSPEELAGLACEEEVESRLVLERPNSNPWELRHGPFTDEVFRTLPASHWSLLVQDVEKHLPELQRLIEPFRFIPDWRIDDLMISYASAYGSVGPHLDDYDVFLLQGFGKRRWQINTHSSLNDELVPDCDLRILRHFKPEQEWVLSPGDILYLPPRVAHHGVALEPCMTYSIGFRAPSYSDLIGSFVDYLLDDIEPDSRYTDPELRLQDNPGEVSHDTLYKLKTLLRQQLATDDVVIESWFGRFITEPKPHFSAVPESEPIRRTELRDYIRQGGALERNPGSRFAYVNHISGETALFVDGQEYIIGPECAFIAPLLCRHRLLTANLLKDPIEYLKVLELLVTLVSEGYLVIYDDQ